MVLKDRLMSLVASAQGWTAGVAILAAVLIFALVNAINDCMNDMYFRQLDKSSEEDSLVMVVRDGDTHMVTAGNKVPSQPGLFADGKPPIPNVEGSKYEGAPRKHVGAESSVTTRKYKVLERQDQCQKWGISSSEVVNDPDCPKSVQIRAKHSTQFAVGEEVLSLKQPFHVMEPLWFWQRWGRRSQQGALTISRTAYGFWNASGKTVTFFVLPTMWKNSHLGKLGITFAQLASFNMSRHIDTDRLIGGGSITSLRLKNGERGVLKASKNTGKDSTVIIATNDDNQPKVWNTMTLTRGECLVILKSFFENARPTGQVSFPNPGEFQRSIIKLHTDAQG